MGKTRLVLIDGNAILHRAYYALPPLTSRSGQQVGAVYGFSTMLFRVIEDLKPTHMAVAFDTEKPTFRHEEYIGYQAQRPKMESDLAGQIEIVREVIRAMGILFFAVPGFEADDVIGTIAKSAIGLQTTDYRRKKKTVVRRRSTVDEVVIVSGDRDLLQLVDKKIKVYAPIKGLSEARLFDEEGVKEYMGVKPSQIVDYKALIGDPSDNYPGVSGIGPKTATKLISTFGSFDKLYSDVKRLPAALVEKLTKGYESAMLSQRLARIVTDVPVDFSLEEMKFEGIKGRGKLIEKFEELGFKSLVARVRGKEEAKPKKKKDRTGNGQLKLV